MYEHRPPSLETNSFSSTRRLFSNSDWCCKDPGRSKLTNMVNSCTLLTIGVADKQIILWFFNAMVLDKKLYTDRVGRILPSSLINDLEMKL